MGRSLIEMIGVLVVAGILSLGVLVTYGYAVNLHESNETLNEVTKRHYILLPQFQKGNPLNLDEFPSLTRLGYPVTVSMISDGTNNSGYKISIESVPAGVCQRIVHSNYPAIIILNEKGIVPSSTCEESNTLDFIFNEAYGWCDYFDKQGNCCDKENRCCPLDRPLINSSNQCVSCDDSQSIHLGAENIATCSRCKNRIAIDYYCSLSCPEGLIQDNSGNCRTCNDVSQYYINPISSNISAALACKKLTVSTDADRVIVRHCDMDTAIFGIHDYPNTCLKCDNRQPIKISDRSVLCVQKCPADHIMDEMGNCRKCDEVSQYYIVNYPENLEHALSCPKLTMQIMSQNAFYVRHCEVNADSFSVVGYSNT